MAIAQADIHVKVDKEIKNQSEYILGQIGISMSDLVNMTLRRVIYEKRIPFDTRIIDTEVPESVRVDSKEELLADVEAGFTYNAEHSGRYTEVELREELGL